MTIRSAPIIPEESRFVMPDPSTARPGVDLIAIGADLAPGTLLSAYRSGLFPMPVAPQKRRSKIAWYSPDPRGVLPIDGLKVSRSLRRSRRRFTITMNTAFESVIRKCADPTRDGHWINEDFINAYTTLESLGWAHSVEVWEDDVLVGGLYGLRIEGFFAGESMFHTSTDASKVALVGLVEWLRSTNASLLDVQWATPHLETLGVVEIGREEYLRCLRRALEPSR